MKKVFCTLLLIIFLIMYAAPVFAADNAEISFDTYKSPNGENVCVDINLSDSKDPSMLQFCVAYDSEKLEIVSVSSGNAFDGNSAPVVNQTDGKVYFIWDSFTPLENGGTMLHIEFEEKSEGKTEVYIDESESFVIADSSFNDIKTTIGKAEIDSGKPNSSEQIKDPQTSEQEKPAPGFNNGIIIDKNEAEIGVGEEITVEITEETEEEVIWSSSNENVVKVEDGKVVPVSPGTATVTVTTEDGQKEATCVITVTEDDLVSGDENGETVEVISGNKNKESVPAWAIVVIVVVVIGIGTILFFILKKIKK